MLNFLFSAVLQKITEWKIGKIYKDTKFSANYYLSKTYPYDNDVKEGNCCEHCGQNYPETDYIVATKAKHHSDGGTCKCYSKSYYIRTEKHSELSVCYKVEYFGRKDTERRKKRNVVSKSLEQEVSCVSYGGGTRAYWKYDYTLPASCWSKFLTLEI